MKKTLLNLARILLPIAVIAWLLYSLEPGQLEQLQTREKDWSLLGLAFLLAVAAVCITFVRWFLLVRALDLPFRVTDAFRLGFLAYLLNFVSVGSVGGDLFKAVFIAREQPGRRTEAVATVVVDRMVGLYALLLVTSLAILISPPESPTAAVATICQMTHIATLVGAIGILMVLTPGFTRGSFSEFLGNLPWVGLTMARLIASVRLFGGRRGTMTLALTLSLLVHSLLTFSFALIANALFSNPPTLAEHFIIVPLSNVAGALPFTPAGLGSLEFAMEELYEHIPSGEPTDVSGVLVALTYRIVTIAIAAVGVVYYWISRAEVSAVLKSAESESAATS